MGRSREFDTDKALDGAMDIFWRQGYGATNLPDLLCAMGITRGSFYKAFLDKETAFLAALDRYDQTVIAAGEAMLGSCPGPRAEDCLVAFFTADPDARRGCFICNAMVELAPENPRVAERTAAMSDRLRRAIRGVLARFEVSGDDDRLDATADLILHLYFGHKAMGRGSKPRDDWRVRLAWILDRLGAD